MERLNTPISPSTGILAFRWPTSLGRSPRDSPGKMSCVSDPRPPENNQTYSLTKKLRLNSGPASWIPFMAEIHGLYLADVWPLLPGSPVLGPIHFSLSHLELTKESEEPFFPRNLGNFFFCHSPSYFQPIMRCSIL